MGVSPFKLVYNMEANISLPLDLSTWKLQTLVEGNTFYNGLEKRILYLTQLEEEREEMVY